MSRRDNPAIFVLRTFPRFPEHNLNGLNMAYSIRWSKLLVIQTVAYGGPQTSVSTVPAATTAFPNDFHPLFGPLHVKWNCNHE